MENSMSNTSKRSALPWRVESDLIIRQDNRPINNSGVLIASVHGNSQSGFFPTDEEAVANAAFIVRAVNSHEPMKAALEAYQAAQAMPTYGDSSDFVWPESKMRVEGDHNYGYICEKHGLGYQAGCLCCRNDRAKYVEEKNVQARRDRDDAFRAAGDLARAALAAAEN
jgi:hypothetical protein